MTLILRLTVLTCVFSLPMFAADNAALEKRIDELTRELAALKLQVQQQAESRQLAAPVKTTGETKTATDISSAAAAPAPEAKDTTIGGYGEITYTGYRTDSSRNQADLRRLVLLFGHRFSDQLSFNSEIEWEHAVTSSSDKGESEIEQAFLDYRFTSGPTIRGGLFLIPLGLLNENHEPPVFYGVNRNEVETRIIPTTWREGGVSVHGATEFGLDYNVGLTTGFDTTKFDDPATPLAASHQELQLARARDLSLYGAVNYRGVLGLTLGAGVFSGNSTHGNAAFKADPTTPDFGSAKGRVTLWETHARWQPGRWDIEALYAAGSIGDAARIDTALQDFNQTTGSDRPYLPSRLEGWYLQAAYKAWAQGDLSLAPFVRYEFFDTQAGMPAGFASDPANRDHVFTAGLSFWLDPQVVIKADYQKYQDNSLNDRYNLGLGFMY